MSTRPRRSIKRPLRYCTSADEEATKAAPRASAEPAPETPPQPNADDEDVKPELHPYPPTPVSPQKHQVKPEPGLDALEGGHASAALVSTNGAPVGREACDDEEEEDATRKPKKRRVTRKRRAKEEPKEEDEEYKPEAGGSGSGAGGASSAEAALAATAALGPQIIPPSKIKGTKVIWDDNVKTIIKTNARKIYKLNDFYLDALDREESTNRDGYPMYLYSEHQVQAAAISQRGGLEFYRAYLRQLHDDAISRALHSGDEPPPPLSDKKYPLAIVPYFKWGTPKDHQDQTVSKESGLRPANRPMLRADFLVQMPINEKTGKHGDLSGAV